LFIDFFDIDFDPNPDSDLDFDKDFNSTINQMEGKFMKKPINKQDWLDLYDAADRFREAQPWDWFSESDMFAIQDPDSKEWGFCSILGGNGEHFALHVYLGAEGLYKLNQMVENAAKLKPMAGLRLQKCLAVSFEDREFMQPEELRQIKSLGLKYRGSRKWPSFHNFEPGYYPWFFEDEWQVRMMRYALEQALVVVQQYRDEPEVLFSENQFLARIPNKKEKPITWTEKWIDAPPYDPLQNFKKKYPLNEVKLETVARLKKPTNSAWQVGLFDFPEPLQDGGERPYLPYVIIVVDKESEMILGINMIKPSQYPAVLSDLFIDFLSNAPVLPGTVGFNIPEVGMLLQPILQRLNIEPKMLKAKALVNKLFRDMLKKQGH